MVGEGQSLDHTTTSRPYLQLRQSSVLGEMGRHDTSAVLDICYNSGGHETLHQIPCAQKPWLG